METKLTLRLDKDLIEEAKNTARFSNTSLSKMVSDYFRVILRYTKKKKSEESPILSEISGIIHSRLTKKKIRNGYRKYLMEKYL